MHNADIASYRATLHFLRTQGYEEVPTDPLLAGQFSVRGDTLLLIAAGSSDVYRLSYFGDTLESQERQVAGNWEKADATLRLRANALVTQHGDVYPGEYIVHPHHGVGIFRGITEQEDFEGNAQVYMVLEYAGGDKLRVQYESRSELMPYIGTRHPRLTRLNSKAWMNTRSRVEKDLIKAARQLLKLYAARQMSTRPIFELHSDWQEILASGAGFELTSDQERCLQEIIADITVSKEPMDRLLCGDVGFGKTEVALRAAAHVLAAGKQVIVLAPTTVLVEQHYQMFVRRFANLPVRVGQLSRLAKEGEHSTLAKIKEGKLDLIVGTHRLLGRDIEYKDLGMLIIDEEQKFGVAHKERLKSLRPHLDVLSMSATPIPRTLSMSLSGLRGFSVIRHAPTGRLPIETVVEPFTFEHIVSGLSRELSRGGQVYVVHPRVMPLRALAEQIHLAAEKAGFPEAKIVIAHGQLSDADLAIRLGQFTSGEADILVASTIIENGVDSERANTLFVCRSELFGLSDLYQLRGRVGRRSIQAYAYLFTGSERALLPGDEEFDPILTKNAKERLQALVEADTLGSGWDIALRDLQIRGGGNLLGNEQHGSMEAIGLLLYAQLLQEEIGRQALAAGIEIFKHTGG